MDISITLNFNFFEEVRKVESKTYCYLYILFIIIHKHNDKGILFLAFFDLHGFI